MRLSCKVNKRTSFLTSRIFIFKPFNPGAGGHASYYQLTLCRSCHSALVMAPNATGCIALGNVS